MQANDLFTAITDRLIADIEAGTGDWVMPWHSLANVGTPVNADGRPYRGMNALWLAMNTATIETSPSSGAASGVWSTYRSWQRHGCQVRRGSHGTMVTLWKPTQTEADAGSDAERQTAGRRLIARVFTVFPAEMVDGADKIVARRTADRPARDTNERISDADRYFGNIGAAVTEAGNRAFYSPSDDSIRMPTFGQFTSPSAFYSTKAHEFAHWTGHTSRLNRELSGRFGSDAYAAEELVAELTAALWCGQMGISAATRQDHAAYVSGWLTILKADAR